MVIPFYLTSVVALAAVVLLSTVWPPAIWLLALVGPLVLLGIYDTIQSKHAIRRNFPVLGRLRYLFEFIRPELQQYFIESETDGRPLSREMRSIIYERAKDVRDTMPFGTQQDVYETGYEWMNHSLAAHALPELDPRILVGGKDCKQPYSASVLNTSAMSFGALSRAAVEAINGGAKLGNFFQNTGEGGLTRYHLEPGGDVCWQIGTGYFGCRNSEGNFDPDLFQKHATHPNVKMIEIKLSQGAKPGHGGILPAVKNSKEIAAIRGVPVGTTVISPPGHTAFDSPLSLCAYIKQLRELSGGKPIGFKLCVGVPSEFVSICLGMKQTGILPDFITVDGGEGGTGAAPPEFSDSMGVPLTEGLLIVNNALVGFGLRDQIRVIASGKVFQAFDIASRIAVGADMCNSARGFMLSVGCIQARRCNTNTCPTGVATQESKLIRGLVVHEKRERVANYHRRTVESFVELLAAAGLSHPSQLQPRDVFRRISRDKVLTFEEIYEYLEPGALLSDSPTQLWARWISKASVDSFHETRLQGRPKVEA
ncbi:MAG: FMN-binding glutamate synthase family protein [Planctomycetota bacterium]|jgi:glutamate synthase domain-containing protein 2|nr:FMN-binding glutamate synthase family protein [Planctomycetota bacterium]